MAAIDCKSVHQQNPRTAFSKDHPSPTLLIARRMIDQAFHDALQQRQGNPTQIATDARDWLAARTDWTLHAGVIPPPDLRPEFYGTFEWACRCLGENPDQVRARGLALAHGIGSSQGRETWRRRRGLDMAVAASGSEVCRT